MLRGTVKTVGMLLGLLLLAWRPAWAAPEHPWMHAPGLAEYPKASAVILQDLVSIDVAADGGYTLREHDVVRILTEDGQQRYERISRLYDDRETDVQVNAANIFMPNGETHEVPPDRITTEAPPAVQANPLYQHVRQTTVTFGKVPGSSVVEFDISTHHRGGGALRLCEASFMQDTDPLLDSTFEVSFPANVHLAYRGFGGMRDTAPQVEERDGRRVWRWHVASAPPLVQERGMPPISDVTSKVMVSSFTSWDEVAADLARRWNAATDPQGTDAARYLSRIKAQPGESRLDAIVRSVEADTTLLPLELSPSEWTPSRLQDTLAAKVLSEIDQTALILGLLRADGIVAWPAFTSPGDVSRIVRDFPSLQYFTSVLVATPQGREPSGRVVFHDLSDAAPGPGSLPGNLQGRDVLLVSGPHADWRTTPRSVADENREFIVMEARVDPDGSMAELIEMDQYGAMNAIWRDILTSVRPDEYDEEVFQRLVEQVDRDAKLNRRYFPPLFPANNPLHVELSLDYNKALQQGGDGVRLRLPFLPVRRLANFVSLDKAPRVYPVDLLFPSHEDKRLHLVLPEGYRVRRLPPPVLRENAIGSFQIVYNSQGRNIWALSRLVVYKPDISAQEYPLFEELVKAAQQAEDDPVLVEPHVRASGHK